MINENSAVKLLVIFPHSFPKFFMITYQGADPVDMGYMQYGCMKLKMRKKK